MGKKGKRLYRILETERFKIQKEKLPKKEKEELKKIMEEIAINPHNTAGSMSVFGPPSAEELKQWMVPENPTAISLVLEYLQNKDCLNKKGSKLAQDFCNKYKKDWGEDG